MRPESCISAGLCVIGLVGLSAIVFSQHARARTEHEIRVEDTETLREQVRLLRDAVEELNAQALTACNHEAAQRAPRSDEELVDTWHRLLTTGALSRVTPPLDVRDPSAHLVVQSTP